ncbi:hypothetical protein ABI59_20980 [Acidobacteria bacterium Mor1]|nr:hypothetical protein ABI59_20980 [Acidobacteria bacterium Mor1]
MKLRCLAVCVLLLVALAAFDGPRAQGGHSRGFVDGTQFIDLVGEDALSVEVRLPRSLLRLACAVDEDLCELVDELELIHAVVLDLSEVREAERMMDDLRQRISAIDKRLRGKGWERIAMVREGRETVRVLILNTEETVDGLLVMMVDDEEMVFANLAGTIDLRQLAETMDHFDLPGTEKFDWEEVEREQRKRRKDKKGE